MTMTREKMKELHALKPKKRFFVLSRDGIKKRAHNTLVDLVSKGADPMTAHHAHFAPLTRDEMKQVREDTAALLKEFKEKEAKEAYEAARGPGKTRMVAREAGLDIDEEVPGADQANND